MGSIQRHIILHLSLSTVYPYFFTSAYFIVQPYRRCMSLIWKKPFLFSNLCLLVFLVYFLSFVDSPSHRRHLQNYPRQYLNIV